MRLKKIFILLIAFYTLQVAISACNFRDCSGGGVGKYELQGITLNHVDNTGDQYMITTSSQVSKSAYGLLASFELDYNSTAMSGGNPFWLLTSAYACDPAPRLHGLDTITSIQVLTLQDFDSEHPAGSDVSGSFQIFGIDQVVTLDDYVEQFGVGKIHDLNHFYLMLTTPPSETGPFQFKLEAFLKDGRKLEATTTQINLVE